MVRAVSKPPTRDGPVKVVRVFIASVNAADPDALAELMTPSHRFIDALGHHFDGREAVREGWATYFRWFPDYRIAIDELLSRGNTVSAFGTASGTFAGELRDGIEARYASPAAWRATVDGGKIATWQVYCDVSAQQRILAAAR